MPVVMADMDIERLIYAIADRLRRAGLIVWCGAGISVASGLPVVRDFVAAILNHTDLASDERARIAEAVPSRLPFERLMEVVLEGMDVTARREVLAVFGAGQPSRHHVFIARLAKRGMLKAIFTTNFDPHLEDACAEEGMERGRDFEVCSNHAAFAALVWPPERPRIVKLHGTVEDPEKLAITVARVATPGSVQNVVAPVRWAFGKGTNAGVLALGYSFSDRFDLSPAIAGSGGAGNQKLIVDLQFTKAGDHSFAVGQTPRWGSEIPHPLSSFENRWHVYGDWSEVLRRVGEILELEDPVAGKEGVAWRELLDDSFDRLDKMQPGLPRVVLAGQMLSMIGDDVAAVPYLRRSVEIAEKGRFERVHLAALQALGGALVRAGDVQGAFSVLEEAERLASKIDGGQHADHVQALLGMLYQDLGAAYTSRARDHYDHALQIARRSERGVELVPHLAGLASSWMRIGDFDAAEQAHRQALAIVEESGDLYRKADVYGNIGTMFYMLRDYREALKWYQKARATAQLAGDVEKEGIHVLNMANLFAKEGKYREALALYREARGLLRVVLPEGHPTVQVLIANESLARKRALES
jgi:tetratricopeptide (TPR) repeat protein